MDGSLGVLEVFPELHSPSSCSLSELFMSRVDLRMHVVPSAREGTAQICVCRADKRQRHTQHAMPPFSSVSGGFPLGQSLKATACWMHVFPGEAVPTWQAGCLGGGEQSRSLPSIQGLAGAQRWFQQPTGAVSGLGGFSCQLIAQKWGPNPLYDTTVRRSSHTSRLPSVQQSHFLPVGGPI